jgi:hypothetical protein
MKSKSPSPVSLGRLVSQFLTEMYRYDAGRTLPILHASKLTTPQLAVLEFARTPCTVSAAAEHVGLSRPATSQLVQKLVERGFFAAIGELHRPAGEIARAHCAGRDAAWVHRRRPRRAL